MDKNQTYRLVTLTSDWGQHDYYTGMLKGQILSACPNFQTVDLAHNVPSFSISSAAFIVKHSYASFPHGSIHLVMVNSEMAKTSRILFFEHQHHIFLLPDNGLLSLMFGMDIPDPIYLMEEEVTGSFTSLQLMLKILKGIYAGNPLEEIGVKTSQFIKKLAFNPIIDKSSITGIITYIDSYKNAITNIPKSLFHKVGLDRHYAITVQSSHNMVNRLSIGYDEVENGELLALFNSADLLEIAIRNGKAAELLSLSIGASVRISFSDNEW